MTAGLAEAIQQNVTSSPLSLDLDFGTSVKWGYSELERILSDFSVYYSKLKVL